MVKKEPRYCRGSSQIGCKYNKTIWDCKLVGKKDLAKFEIRELANSESTKALFDSELVLEKAICRRQIPFRNNIFRLFQYILCIAA